MSYYYSAAGQRFDLPERPLEPPDCWDGADGLGPEEYDGAEDEMNGRLNRVSQKGWQA